MGVLQEIFEGELRSNLRFSRIGARLVARKLEKAGVAITDSQLADIETQLDSIRADEYSIEIPDLVLWSFEQAPEAAEDVLHIDLTDCGQDMEGIVHSICENARNAIPRIVREASADTLRVLKDRLPAMLKDNKQRHRRFERNLGQVWSRPLSLLEMLLVISLEAGEEFNAEFRGHALQDEDLVFDVLTRLHARACQIGSEILTLLRSGYADGAHARWRLLHEVAVIGLFVKAHGNDVAERYLLHDGIESYRAAMLYQKHCTMLRCVPLMDGELDATRKWYDSLVRRFGPSYSCQYGWASAALRKDSPSIQDIEKDVGLDHMRPYYKLASHNVHANPKGVLFKLGLMPEGEGILLAGPSNAGLATAGHGCAISLSQITIALLITKPNIDRLVACDIFQQLTGEIGHEFLRVHTSLAERATRHGMRV